MSTHTIKVESLSPLYIGGESSSNRKEGFDFICDIDSEESDGDYPKYKISIIDSDSVLRSLSKIELKDFVIALEEGNSRALTKIIHKRINEDSIRFIRKTRLMVSREIKAFVRNGLGYPYIPGSSIKGAIRSVLIHQMKSLISDKNDLNLEDLFGSIDNNVMSFLQVGDLTFPEQHLEISHAKIFNLHRPEGKWIGGWKNGIDNNSQEFLSDKFVTHYESIKMKKKLPSLTIKFDEEKMKFRGANLPTNLAQLLPSSGNYIESLFKAINQCTKRQIEKEIAFYDEYEINETEELIGQFDNILDIIDLIDNSNLKSCVLRIGQGSGYYGITGDWFFDNHLQSIKAPLKFEKDIYLKSRKWNFVMQDGEPYFSPMGFVKLTL